MKTLVVLDETIVSYLLALVEGYGFPDHPCHDETARQLRVALEMLARAKADDEKRETKKGDE
jgi:hypothetical protein